MFFRAAVLSLLGCLIIFHLETQVRLAVLSAPAPARAGAAPPPIPIVVVAPGAGSTRVVDVRRDDVDRALADPDLARTARIVPAFKDGVMRGFKIYAVAPASPLAALGIENGDLLHAINDTPLDSPGSALASLGRAPDLFDIELERRGQPLRILVVVHGG